MVIMSKPTGVPLVCCGKPMDELIPGQTDGAHEKHVPVYKVDGRNVNVKVGDVEHPMIEAHYIEWIAVVCENGYQIKYLKPNEKPVADFTLAPGEKVVAVYAYCNLHGLWKA